MKLALLFSPQILGSGDCDQCTPLKRTPLYHPFRKNAIGMKSAIDGLFILRPVPAFSIYYPLGESNPCYRTENPVSWATRRRGQQDWQIIATKFSLSSVCVHHHNFQFRPNVDFPHVLAKMGHTHVHRSRKNLVTAKSVFRFSLENL